MLMTGSFGDVVREYLNIMVSRPFCSGILFLWREAKAEFPFFFFFLPRLFGVHAGRKHDTMGVAILTEISSFLPVSIHITRYIDPRGLGAHVSLFSRGLQCFFLRGRGRV